MKILLGGAAMQYLVEVPTLPKVGDMIMINKNNMVAAGTEFARDIGRGLLVKITSRGQILERNGERITAFDYESAL